MLIIVEGPDCVGKTVFTQRLARAIPNSRIVHCGPPTEHPLMEWEYPLETYTPGAGETIICDRWHLGEVVYGPLKRERSTLTDEAWLHIELFLASKGAVCVVLDATNETLLQRHDARGDDFISDVELVLVAAAYRKLAHRPTPLPVMHAIQIHENVAEHFLPTIISTAEVYEFAAKFLNPFSTYVGPPQTSEHQTHVLLLGDRRGPLNLGHHAKAFVPYPATSGAWLLRAIRPWAWLGDVGIANANEEDVVELVLALNDPHVVALGRAAHERCAQLGVPHGAVPHPQYMRRFRHQQEDAYSAGILYAAKTQEVFSSWPK